MDIKMNQEVVESYNMDEVADDAQHSDYESIIDNQSAQTDKQDKSDDYVTTTSESRILFLGKTVAGKTVLCKLLAGGEQVARLHVEKRIGQLLIVDDAGAIGVDGTSTTQTPTMIPCPPDWKGLGSDLVVLCDCPGFGDTRGWHAEVQQLQQVREVALSASALKIVFVVEHASVVAGACVDSFVGLVRYAVALIKDLAKYRASMCLVVNKVPNTTRKVRGAGGKAHYELKEDKEIEEETRCFLREVLVTLHHADRLSPSEATSSEICIKFLSDLLEDDRLVLLRCPDEEGPVEDCELLQDSKKRVLEQLHALQWVETRSEDLGYTLSLSASKEVSERVQRLRQEIPRLLDDAVLAMKEYYYALLRGKRVDECRTLLQEHIRCSTKLTVEGSGVPCATCFGSSELEQLFEHIAAGMEELRYLQRVIEYDVFSSVEHNVVKHRQSVYDFMKGWLCYLDFYDQLSHLVWSYDVQSRQSDFDVCSVVAWGHGQQRDDDDDGGPDGNHITLSTANVVNFVSLLREQGLSVSPELDAVQWDAAMLDRVNALLGEALRHRPLAWCDNGGGVVVQGECVVLSKALRQAWDLSGGHWPTGITVLAHDTVYIDCDVDAVGKRLRIALLAPRWEVTPTEAGPGMRHIRLDGSTPDPSRLIIWARSVRSVGGDGSDGEPGLPGGSAGAFLGACAEVVNGRFLRISACGGNGGNGQNGTAGANGEDGQDAVPAFYSESRQQRMNDPSFVFGFLYNQRWRTFYGLPGREGGNGGNGGEGGCGGNPGDVVMLMPTGGRSTVDIYMEATAGKEGKDGDGGEGGRGGKSGRHYTGRQHFLFAIPVGVSTDESGEPPSREANGRKGKPGFNKTNKQKPEPGKIFNEDDKTIYIEIYRSTFSEPGKYFPTERQIMFGKFLEMVKGQLAQNVSARWQSVPH